MPENYDSELARETYRTIEGDSTEKIPVTAEIVN